MAFKKITKRDGRVVDFDKEKITNAIFKAAEAVGGKDRKIAEDSSDLVVKELEEKFKGAAPTVEQVQDAVEKILIEQGHAKTAKAYILYRKERAEERRSKAAVIGKEVKTKVSLNSLRVLKERYLLKDDEGNVIETPDELVRRVAKNIAKADLNYGAKDIKKTEGKFYRLMANLDFLPNSPTLMNAGTDIQQLAACFVLPIEDSMEGIFTTLMHAAIIHKSGGGTGFSFSRLRARNSRVKSTQGVASGPVSFLTVYNAATDVIKQGGKRRGANMGILRIDHPDILDFISCKEKNEDITNFNISVAFTEDFMNAVENDEDYELIDPSTKEVVEELNARTVFDLIISGAWRNGDPGIVFIDRINKDNPTPALGEIESTNPCVVGRTLVPTEFGLMRMEDLYKNYSDGGIKIATDNRVPVQYNNNGQKLYLLNKSEGVILRHITRVLNNGKKKVVKMVTKSGYEITVTKDHKVFSSNKQWVKAEELKMGDSVCVQGGAGIFNSDKKLKINPERINKLSKKRMNLPVEWSKELGQVMGWLVGDGWLRDKDENRRVGFVFGEEDKELMNYFKCILNKYYNYNIKDIKRENNVFHLSYHGKGFVEFFKELGVKAVSSKDKVVPESIFTSTEESVVGFLQALFTADGTIGTDKEIRLTSSSKKLLKGVQLLILNMGIKSKIYSRKYSNSKPFAYTTIKGEDRIYRSHGLYYELIIDGLGRRLFLDKIGFLNMSEIGTRSLPALIGSKEPISEHAQKHDSSFSSESVFDKKQGKLVKSVNFCKRMIFEDKIVSIKDCGEEVVYDLTEPETLSFITNGIVSLDCGEQPLLPYEACNLGSLNLEHFVKDNDVDWERLKKVVHGCIHFLDNVIDMSKYPIQDITEIVKQNRKIGLGVMGWADMLVQLKIPYNSEEGIKLAEKVMGFIKKEADNASIELAKTRGVFPAWEESIYNKDSKHFQGSHMELRNATRTTIAPTGTIGMIADASGGVEPLFALSYVKRVMDGQELYYLDGNFKKALVDSNVYSEELMERIINKPGIQNIEEIPEDIRKVFVVAHDVSPEYHLKMQGAFQKFTDNAVSKTVNFLNSATIDEVKEVYLLAYKLGCKGVTVYRDGSKDMQVLNFTKDIKKEKKGKDVCPECNSKMIMSEGCAKCIKCGYSVCNG